MTRLVAIKSFVFRKLFVSISVMIRLYRCGPTRFVNGFNEGHKFMIHRKAYRSFCLMLRYHKLDRCPKIICYSEYEAAQIDDDLFQTLMVNY